VLMAVGLARGTAVTPAGMGAARRVAWPSVQRCGPPCWVWRPPRRRPHQRRPCGLSPCSDDVALASATARAALPVRDTVPTDTRSPPARRARGPRGVQTGGDRTYLDRSML